MLVVGSIIFITDPDVENMAGDINDDDVDVEAAALRSTSWYDPETREPRTNTHKKLSVGSTQKVTRSRRLSGKIKDVSETIRTMSNTFSSAEIRSFSHEDSFLSTKWRSPKNTKTAAETKTTPNKIQSGNEGRRGRDLGDGDEGGSAVADDTSANNILFSSRALFFPRRG